MAKSQWTLLRAGHIRYRKFVQPKNCVKLDKNDNIYSDKNVYHVCNMIYLSDVISKWKSFMIPVFCAIVCYINSLNGEFVHDDIKAIVNNKDVTGNNSIYDLLYNDFWGKSLTDISSHKSYRPLTVLTFRLNHILSGLSPYHFHIVNVFLHSVSTSLFVFICSRHVFFCKGATILAGVIFAVHPVHVEAVSGIVGRADMLSSVFFQISFILYIRCIDGSPMYNYGGCLLSAVMAMLCKENGITIIGVIIIMDVYAIYGKWRTKNRYTSDFLRVLTAIITLILVLLYRLSLMGNTLPQFQEEDNPSSFSPCLLTRILSHGYIHTIHMWLLICPSHLSYDWQMGTVPLVYSIWDIRNLYTMCMYAVIIVFSTRILSQNKHSKQYLIGALFLVLPFLPASNIFFRVGFVVAERILYISSLGSSIITSAAISSVYTHIHSRHRRLYQICVIIMCIMLASRTVIRNQVWRNRESLFKSGIQDNPANGKTHFNYANYLKDIQQRDASITHYKESIRLWPRHSPSYNNLGTLTTNNTDAENLYKTALRYTPKHANAHFNLGSLYKSRGSHDLSTYHLSQAIMLDPQCSSCMAALGDVYLHTRKTELAFRLYREALHTPGVQKDVIHNIAVTVSQTDKYISSQMVLPKGLNKSSASTEYFIMLRKAASLCSSSGKYGRAEMLYKLVLSVPQDANTLDMAGVFYFNRGNTTLSLNLFYKAHRLDPDNTNIMVHLAKTYAIESDYIEARKVLENVLEIDSTHGEALQELAAVNGILNEHNVALPLLEKAIQVTRDSSQLARLYLDLAKHYKDLDDIVEAIKNFKKAIKLDATLTEAQHYLGVAYHLQGNYTEAKHHYETARRLEPGNALLVENIKKLQAVFGDSQIES